MTTIGIFPKTGEFAENKDIAREIRLNEISPAIRDNDEIIIDFNNVISITQSFAHALLSELIREYTGEILDKISFKNCNDTIKRIINIVVDYMQV